MTRLANTLLVVSLMLMSLFVVANGQSDGESTAALIAKLDCPDRVKDVEFSPDGELLAAGFGWNVQGGAKIWSVADRAVLATLAVSRSEDANVECVAFSPDGRLFAAANWSGDVMLWTVGKWSSHRVVLANRGSPKTLAFSPDSTKIGFASETAAVIHDLRSGKTKVLASKTNQRNDFIGIAFSRNGKSAILFRDDAIQILDLETGKLIKSWKPPGTGFFGNISAHGNYVIAGGGSIYGKKSVEIWNVRDEKRLGDLSAFKNGLFALAISHSEKLFALAGGDYGSGGDLSLWSMTEPREIGFVSFGEFPMQGLAFSPDDKVLAAGSDDGFVLLYAVDRIRGPEVKKQDYALCGEVLIEGDKAFLIPISKVPRPMRRDFSYAWKLQIVNADLVAGLEGSPIVLEDWNLESSSDDNRGRITKFRKLQPGASIGNANHIIFGDVQNPGWDKGFIAKVYGDGAFVATNNYGRCLAYGSVDQLNTDYESIKKRLVSQGLLEISKEPLTRGMDHYRTRFIGITSEKVLEMRSDGENVDFSKPSNHPTKKEQDFARIFDQERSFIDSILKAGLKSPPN